jgi:hypothetical protein
MYVITTMCGAHGEPSSASIQRSIDHRRNRGPLRRRSHPVAPISGRPSLHRLSLFGGCTVLGSGLAVRGGSILWCGLRFLFEICLLAPKFAPSGSIRARLRGVEKLRYECPRVADVFVCRRAPELPGRGQLTLAIVLRGWRRPNARNEGERLAWHRSSKRVLAEILRG